MICSTTTVSTKIVPDEPKITMSEINDMDYGIFRKMLGAGKTVVHSTVNYGNNVSKRFIGTNPANSLYMFT